MLALTKLERMVLAMHGVINHEEVERDRELEKICLDLLYLDIDDLPEPCIEVLIKMREYSNEK